MTVTYTGRVPNGSTFGCFWKVFGIWRGSVFKLVWREFLAYLVLFYIVNLIYRTILNESQRTIFERVQYYFNAQTELIPMSIFLGFYVQLVVKRWWEQYKLLPWPDTLALFLNAGIPGADETQRLMRRNIVRYAVLAYVITLQRVSLRVKQRFPTYQHIVDSGLMMESERKVFELMDGKTPMSKYWMPLVWATNIINRARKESLITSDHIVQVLLTELSDIRRRLGALIGYDTVCVPLVYTQVVTLALYVYFAFGLLGAQTGPNMKVKGGGIQADLYFPYVLAMQFFFYIGWLKVAEVLINPFGEDDDDIELNWLIDRHIKAAYMIVDEMHEEHPELLRDQYWEEVVPKELPYTVASEHYRREEPKGSAETYKVKTQDALYANLIMGKKHSLAVHDDMYADYESVDTPIVERRKGSISWFQRQISRTGMSSIRSASTAYSSGGLFGRHRGNSVYSTNPENGQLPGLPPISQPKMSIYDRLVGRRSSRSRNLKQNSKVPISVKHRPRIPTPDVTKEVVEKENRLAAANAANLHQQFAQGMALVPSTLHTYPPYGAGDTPIVQVVLSPIQELDGSGSCNNTLHANQPGTTALAQAILTPGLGAVLNGNSPVSLPMTVSQLNSLGFSSVQNSPLLTRVNPTYVRAFERYNEENPIQTVTLTELNNSSPENETAISSRESDKSEASTSSNNSKISTISGITMSMKNFDDSKDEGPLTITPSASAPSSLTALVPDDNRSRKTSVASQNNAGKRGEVYV